MMYFAIIYAAVRNNSFLATFVKRSFQTELLSQDIRKLTQKFARFARKSSKVTLALKGILDCIKINMISRTKLMIIKNSLIVMTVEMVLKKS